MQWISILEEIKKSLSKHYSFSLTHNEHKLYYEKIEEYLEDSRFDEVSKKDKELCIKNDEIWELQWYPITPIGSYDIFSPTLQGCLEKYLEWTKTKDEP